MIDLQSETIVTFREARALRWLRGRRGRISQDSLRRWSLRGLKGVVLETRKIGGATTVTSIEALLRFLDRINGSDDIVTHPTAQRAREIAAADGRLDDANIK